MRIPSVIAFAFGAMALLLAASCSQSGLLGELFGGGNDNSAGDPSGGGNGNTNTNDNSAEPDPGTSRPRPEDGTGARVRNESAFRADVTLRFIEDDTVAHLAFVRVLPTSTTTVTGPTIAETIEFSGSSESGFALPPAVMVFGVDFTADLVAEYTIPAEPGGGNDPPPPPSITLLEPASDITLALGNTLFVRWTDIVPTSGTIVRIGVQPADDLEAALAFLGAAVGAALDGSNDELTLIVEDVNPGSYRVVGQIDDGTNVVRSAAPGRVDVIEAGGNVSPSIRILKPLDQISVRNGDELEIEWTDEDPDDNATITFSLEIGDPNIVGVGPYTIGSDLAEDPDGVGDTFSALIEGVLAGVYDLVARIDDGELSGTWRVARVVRVLPDPANDPPRITLLEPDTDIIVLPGGSFTVRWVDSDANDDASISLYLDPDLNPGPFDGDEILLVSALREDEDGAGDRITLGVPVGVAEGSYRIAGVITDGMAEMTSWAPGVLHFGVQSDPPILAISAPAQNIRTRLGESFNVFVQAENLPIGVAPRLYLSNEAFGGTARVEVTPPILLLNENTVLTLPTGGASIPNIAWPRSFELIAEVTGGVSLVTAKAPGLISVRQEVEIVHAEVVNCDCATGETVDDPRGFIGFHITYYGGGFTDRDPRGEVELWLTADGEIPLTNAFDIGHGILGFVSESPNAPRTVQLPLGRLVTVESGQMLHLIIRQGTYQLVPVVESAEFGRIISPPAPELLEVCLCTPDR